MESLARQKKALYEVGDRGKNATYEIALPLSTVGGTWRISFCGHVTAAIAFNATREEIAAKLSGLLPIGLGAGGVDNVEVVGVPGGVQRVALVGVLGGQPLPQDAFPFSADGSTLQPAAQIAVEQREVGALPMLTNYAAKCDLEYSNITQERLRFLLLKRDLLDAMLGESQKGVDTEVNNATEKWSQQHGNLLSMRRLVQSEIEGISNSGSGSQVPLSAPFSTKLRKTTPNGAAYGQLGFRDGRFR